MWNSAAQLWKRKCVNPNSTDDVCETYVTPFQTTGIPVIIGLCLFAILTVVIFFVVRKNRKRVNAKEAAKDREIDDDVELEFTVPPNNKQGYNEQRPGSDLGNPFEAPPPKYV